MTTPVHPEGALEEVPPIVSAEWLAGRLAEGDARVRVVDVRWYLDGRSGREAYEAGHIEGAVFVDLDEVLAAPATAAEGRHPLPPPEVFTAGLSAAGIADHDITIAYDDLGGMVAGRLVWMLRILGLPGAVLDGGLPAWSGPLATGPGPGPTADATTREVRPWPADAMATADEVAAAVAAGVVVVDARAPERYRGDTEPVDPRAGHIPGAVNLPFATNLDDDGRFRPFDELADTYRRSGLDGDAIVYCGSGVSACHHAVAVEAATGARPRLYVGSWSQWSSDPDRPAATGPEPG
ncbi:MAG: sulfurtransferase [Actinomycetota bacterium]